MHARHPLVGMRLIGQNSVEVADAIREGDAGGRARRAAGRRRRARGRAGDPATRCSTRPPTPRGPPRRSTTETLLDRPLVLYDAHYGNADPTRRQLHGRLQQLGGRLAPHIEVEYLAGALRLAAMGVGDTIVARAAVDGGLSSRTACTRRRSPSRCYDTLAVVKQRSLPLSPATRELLSIALDRLRAFERRRARG